MNTDKRDINYFNRVAKDFDSDPMKVQRAQKFAEKIRSEIEICSNFTGLEYGCGTGLAGFFLQPFMRKIVLADNSPGMLEVLNKKIETTNISNISSLHLDLTCGDTTIPNERFNIIFTLMTLHHILDTTSIAKTFHSLLTQPGYLCIGDLEKEDGSFHGENFVGHNGFERTELARIMEAAGFVNIRFQELFSIEKILSDGRATRTFPLFLMVAEKK